MVVVVVGNRRKTRRKERKGCRRCQEESTHATITQSINHFITYLQVPSKVFGIDPGQGEAHPMAREGGLRAHIGEHQVLEIGITCRTCHNAATAGACVIINIGLLIQAGREQGMMAWGMALGGIGGVKECP